MKLEIRNFRGIREMTLDLSTCNRLALFIGDNGSGKSSILDAAAYLISWMINRVKTSGASGKSIKELDITHQASCCWIKATAEHRGKEFCWTLAKGKKGHPKSEVVSDLSPMSEICEEIRQQISETDECCPIPLFAYYPVHRAVLDIPLRIRKRHRFDLLEAYDDFYNGVRFRSFFEWFRNREDLENESKSLLESLYRPADAHYPDPQLEAVRRALLKILPEFERLSVRRNPLHMAIWKNGKEHWINQLSDGEKGVIALIGDLARRLAIANPMLADPLQGEGIVLIDEIDLHLHPGWQRMIIPKILSVFPNCQFLVTTHSPQVLGEVAGQNIRCMFWDGDDGIKCFVPEQAKGLDSSEILETLMGTAPRNEEITGKLHRIFVLIDEEKIPEAKERIERLIAEVNGSIPELVRAQSLVAMLEDSSVEGEGS
ncbi:MAG: AAA family ATPase [Candidatus Sumerlaeota bacterium]|nr:AAA family ATPase [Candidatus Sumerlaeota bacterium]